MESMTYRPVWGGPRWEDLEGTYLYDADRGYLVQGVEDDSGEYVPELYRAWADPAKVREDPAGVGSWIESAVSGMPICTGRARVEALLDRDDRAGAWLEVAPGLPGGTPNLADAVERARAVSLLEPSPAMQGVGTVAVRPPGGPGEGAVRELLEGALTGAAAHDRPSLSYELAYELHHNATLYDPVHGIAVDAYSDGYTRDDNGIYAYTLGLADVARFAESGWKDGRDPYVYDLLDVRDAVAMSEALDVREFELLIRTLAQACAGTGTFVRIGEIGRGKMDELVAICEADARDRWANMMEEPVSEWWDRTRPAEAGRMDDTAGTTFDDVLADIAAGRMGALFTRHPEDSTAVIDRISEISGADRETIMGLSAVTEAEGAERDRADLAGLKETLDKISGKAAGLSADLAGAIEREAETADVLAAYDAYITTACDARLFDTGWMPVGVAEFRENEYVNCWCARREGEDPFGYMYNGADGGRVPVPGETYLDTPDGTIHAFVEDGSVKVDLEKPDGTSGQVAWIEATDHGDLGLYPTPVRVFSYDGVDAEPANRTDVHVNGPEMTYEPRGASVPAYGEDRDGKPVRHGR